MAFSPYYPSYQSPYYPQPMPSMAQNQWSLQNPQQPPAQAATVQPTQQSGGIFWVNSKAEADSWPIAPGCAVALWDSNAPMVYLRKADNTGKPSTEAYDLVQHVDNPPVQQMPQVDLSKYVTIEQLEEILAERLKKPAKPTKPKEDE